MGMTPSGNTLEKIMLGDLVVDTRLVMVKCGLCRNTEHDLAVNLARVMGVAQKAYGAINVCPHCGKNEWLHVGSRLPSYFDEGKLRIRRPVAKRKWVWRDAIYPQVDAERVSKPISKTEPE